MCCSQILREMVDVASLGIKNDFIAHSIRQFRFGDNILFVELNFCAKPEDCRGSNEIYGNSLFPRREVWYHFIPARRSFEGEDGN